MAQVGEINEIFAVPPVRIFGFSLAVSRMTRNPGYAEIAIRLFRESDYENCRYAIR